MKTLLLALLTLSAAVLASADDEPSEFRGLWTYPSPTFPMPVQFWIQPYRVTVAVRNTTGYWIGCQTLMEGYTAWGRYQRAPFQLSPLAPGQLAHSFMTPLASGDYFVNGRGWAWCQYL